MSNKEAFSASREGPRQTELPHYVSDAYERWLNPSFSEQFPRMLADEIVELQGGERPVTARRELIASARGVLDGVIALAGSSLSGAGSEEALRRAARFAIRGRIEEVTDQLDAQEGDDVHRDPILAMAHLVRAAYLRPLDGAEDTQAVREAGLLAESHRAIAAEKLARAIVSRQSPQT